MTKSKNITQAEIDAAKKEHLKAKAKRKVVYCRLFYFLLSVGNIAVVAFLAILNASPEIGHYLLATVSGVSALFFTTKLIGE